MVTHVTRPGATSLHLTQADRDQLRVRRIEAVAAAYPDMTTDHVYRAVANWYRGKPNTGRVHRVIKKAGLL